MKNLELFTGARVKAPTDTNRLEVEREAYIPLMKSLVKLKERQMKRNAPPLIPLFCVDCGEFVRNHNRNVKVRCLDCAEQHRLVLQMQRQEREKLKNKLKRKVKLDKLRPDKRWLDALPDEPFLVEDAQRAWGLRCGPNAYARLNLLRESGLVKYVMHKRKGRAGEERGRWVKV